KQGIYVADTGNHLLRYIDLETNQVSTVAGNGKLQRRRQGEFEPLQVGLASPWGLALRDNLLFIAMAGSHQIWRFDTRSKRIGPYAGSGREGIDDGDLAGSTFSQPSGLSIIGDWLYIADSEDSAVRRIHFRDERVETLVGTGLFDFGDRDGSFKQAKLQHVLGIAAVDPDRLLIADTYNHKLKSVDLRGKRVRTLVGNGKPGDLDLRSGRLLLNEPGGLALAGERMLIADTNNHRIVSYDLRSGEASEWKLTQKQ
ncbi:MAG: thiol-disulfide isomerase, partial [Gammaproteobacteria bacterium]|nr:thiol-disulfide isomerase [Gammaproteobacteria bacterium]